MTASAELIVGLTGMATQLRRMVDGAAFVRDGHVRVRDPEYLIMRLEQAAKALEALSTPTGEAGMRERVLEEALRPFADVLDEGEGADGVMLTFTAPDGHQVITALPGDAFRAAAALLHEGQV